jgi:DNA primase
LGEGIMPLVDYRQARAEVGLHEVLELLGWRARTRVGSQVRGCCPVHGSRSGTSRSFRGQLGKNLWHGFVCGAGGNALDLWAQTTGQELHAAVRDLFARLGRPVPWLRPVSPAKDKKSMNDP